MSSYDLISNFPVFTEEQKGAVYALKDVSSTGANFRLVGGFSMYMLGTVFPTPNTIQRKTQDIDVALSMSVASTGALHKGLLQRGYCPERGNTYNNGTKHIDLLIERGGVTLEDVEVNGRKIPGSLAVRYALENPGYRVLARFIGSGVMEEVPLVLPTVEGMAALKICAISERKNSSDVVDLFNLLSMRSFYGDALGSWKFPNARTGVLKHCTDFLGKIIQNQSFLAHLEKYNVPAPYFEQLIRSTMS